MGRATLVIMAAGMGSRFGGVKQLESVGPNGEVIIDYSIKDALEVGFDKVIFVIRKDLERDFRDKVGRRIEQKVKVEYVFQEIDDIPIKFKKKFLNRRKPWGTGQAILCCKGLVKEPFLVINADDYYGKEAYKKAYDYLTGLKEKHNKLSICMVGFMLKNTLSDNGGVTRGLCKVDRDDMLMDIVETHDIIKTRNGAAIKDKTGIHLIENDSIVSMNMWGFMPGIFDLLCEGFTEFLEKTDGDDSKSEYLLPTIIGDLIRKGNIEAKVLQSEDKWFGVTYKEDKGTVIAAIQDMINSCD